MNTDIIVNKIIEETACSKELALKMAQQVNSLNEKLIPLVNEWCCGKRPYFEYEGISLEFIINKEKVSYIQAIFSMNILINNPQFATMYSNFDFCIDELG